MSAPALQRVVCRKVIVVPFVVREGRLQFLIVKDRAHKEWTFITGGCKAHESEAQSAMRELIEETRSVILADSSFSGAPRYDFTTTYREPCQRMRDRERGEIVVTTYSVFFVDISSYRKQPAEIRSQFRSIKHMRGAYNENLDVTFETLDSFLGKNFVWRFIKQVVVKTPRFAELCDLIVSRSASRGA